VIKKVICQEIVRSQERKDNKNVTIVNKMVICQGIVLSQNKREGQEMVMMIILHIKGKEMIMKDLLDKIIMISLDGMKDLKKIGIIIKIRMKKMVGEINNKIMFKKVEDGVIIARMLM
jgi:hypothetical protein